MADDFKAFRIHCDDAGYRSGIETLKLDDLSPGEVVIETEYSSVNYKDALAAGGKGKILRQFPLAGYPVTRRDTITVVVSDGSST